MTIEEKDLLLRDICARMPYRPKVKIGEYYDYTVIGIDLSNKKSIIVELDGIRIEVSCKNVQPILRPMSSMTEEEKCEYYNLLSKYDVSCFISRLGSKVFDWLNKKGFDYRGLISKGLAIKVTAENNPYKE